ncbi:MAG: mannitol dehydrogenase [Eubacteriales bacterium]|nr:mannitol dehydrogenase [Eubacteriales bacterium]
MRAVMYGAGNIGRGFIGPVFSRGGYFVRFVDVNKELVDALNARGSYPLRVIRGEDHEDQPVTNFEAINGRDSDKVAEAIAECSLMATAVGAKILPFIAPVIAQGLKIRFARTQRPLDIIVCENLMDANLVLAELIKGHLSPDERALFDARVGLVEASIGRMVPVQTDEMRAGDPLRVCVEEYDSLPVDRDGFKGEIPELPGLHPFTPFDYYIRRKLFVHNMGHATCAYLGSYTGKTYIAQAIRDADTALITQNAMLESMAALLRRYQVPADALLNHIYDLLGRFANTGLGDTCQRVGADIPRKMAPEDRMIGSALLCLQMGVRPDYIALGAALALAQYLKEEGLALTEQEALKALKGLSGLAPEDPLTGIIMGCFPLVASGAPVAELRLMAFENKRKYLGPVV